MNFFTFILWFILAELLINGVRYIFRLHKIKIWINIIIIICELLLSFLFAYLVMDTVIGYWPITPFLVALYATLFVDGFIQIIYLLMRLFIKKGKRFVLLTIMSNLSAVIFLTFGMINMQIVKPKYLSYSSSKLENTYRIAFISDMHIGKAQPINTTIKTIRDIKNNNPDFTFIGGDFVDEFTKEEEMKKAIKEFASFSTPVYFIRGNHELTGRIKFEDVEKELTASNIKVVVDEYVTLASDLTLLGRDDLDSKNRKKIEELINPYPSTFLLVIDHQPFDYKNNAKAGMDLQLSGHTHAGQLFPLRMLYSMGVSVYGEYRYNSSILNVSSGASGWYVPFRTEIGCQYEIITLSPAK